MKHVAVDSDIFFFSVGQDKRDRNVRLASSLLEHIDNHPELELCVPFSVLAETVFKTLTSEKESTDPNRLEHITALIELWRKLEIRFLLPSNEAAEICWNLVNECGDRMQPTDRTHLGYALAYGMDYLITTDKILLHYHVPDDFRLKVVSLRDARETIGI
jgi:predicted nucleic acid-binding protein